MKHRFGRFGDEGAGSRTLRAMRPREQLTLDQAVRRAAAAGTVVRHDAVAVFLEVLRRHLRELALHHLARTEAEEERLQAQVDVGAVHPSPRGKDPALDRTRRALARDQESLEALQLVLNLRAEVVG